MPLYPHSILKKSKPVDRLQRNSPPVKEENQVSPSHTNVETSQLLPGK